MSSPLLEDLGFDGSGGMGSFGFKGRLPDPFPFSSTVVTCSHTPPQLLSKFHQGESSYIRTFLPSGERGSRACPTNTGLLLENVCCSEGLRSLETDHRSVGPQSPGGIHFVPYGDSTVCAPLSSPRGLDGVSGLGGRLPASSYSSGVQEVPSICDSRRNLSVQGALLRIDDSSPGIYQGHGSRFSLDASSRLSNVTLPRRLVSSCLLIGGDYSSEGLSSGSLSQVRDPDQPKEIDSSTDAINRLFGHDDSCSSFEGFSDTETHRSVPQSARGVSVLSSSASLVVEKSSRSDGLFFPSDSRISTAVSIPPTSSSSVVGSVGRRGSDLLGRFLPPGSSVVVRSVKSDPRGTTGRPSPRVLSSLRRFRSGLGRFSRRSANFRPLVSSRSPRIHQLQGTQSSSSSSQTLLSDHSGISNSLVFGQYHSNLVPQERGRDEVSSSQFLSPIHSEGMRAQSSPISSPVCVWSSQLHSRRPQPQGSSSRFGMDSGSRGSSRSHQEMASSNRSFCHSPQLPSSSLLLSHGGPHVSRDGRHAPVLERDAGLCLSCLRDGPCSSEEAQAECANRDDLSGSFLASEKLVCGPSRSASRHSDQTSREERPVVSATFPSFSHQPPRAAANCLENIQRTAKAIGLSSGVARQLAYCRRKSTHMNYQYKWVVYRSWCRNKGHSISRPTIAKVADFLLFLRKSKGLSFSAIAGYRSMLSASFRFVLPEISDSAILRDLMKSFRIERPSIPNRAPPWDLTLVLTYLRSSDFEPLSSVSLRQLTVKTLFLVSLATARRVSEIQALSKEVSFSGNDAYLTFLPEFRAKTESEANPLPRFFPLRALNDFVGNDPDELLLCPVRALKIYLERTAPLLPSPRSLFRSPRNPSRQISKNAVSFFLREVISKSYNSSPDPGPSVRIGAHSIRGMATSTAFLKNFSISSILEAATWKSHSVFTTFYLRDVSFSFPQGFGLGPFVAAQAVCSRS